LLRGEIQKYSHDMIKIERQTFSCSGMSIQTLSECIEQEIIEFLTLWLIECRNHIIPRIVKNFCNNCDFNIADIFKDLDLIICLRNHLSVFGMKVMCVSSA
jgi:hypothetical protein